VNLHEIASRFVEEMGQCGKPLEKDRAEPRELWFVWRSEKSTSATIRFEPSSRFILFREARGWKVDLVLFLKNVPVASSESVLVLDLRLNALNFPLQKMITSFSSSPDRIRFAAVMMSDLLDELLRTTEELGATGSVLKIEQKLMGVDLWKWLPKLPLHE
jgi:hypothetical protein